MPREQLAEQLWPEDLLESTRLRLRQETHRLKKALGLAEEIVSTSTSDVALDKDLLETDLDEFRRLIQGGGLTTLSLEDRQSLTSGFLPGWDDLWVVAEKGQAETIQLQAAIAAGRSLLEAHSPESALDLAHGLIPRHPVNEDLRMVAVKAHADLGSMANAVAEYQELRRRMKDQLGQEPSTSSSELVRALGQRGERSVHVESPSLASEIPNPIEPLAGREVELAQIQELLAHHRLVTLTGPGGIGKTRLAIEVARALADQGERRVAFVSLMELSDPGEWGRFILSQLKVNLPGESDHEAYLANILRESPTVLVMDNVEHLLPEAAVKIRRLVEQAPHLKVLATSIYALKVGGEALLPIGPLDPETGGRQLLLDAMRLHRPLAAAMAAKDPALLAIARRLDGYPLALRLAAPRFRFLSPVDLLTQLDNLEILASSSPDLPQRHRSLEAALQASAESLTAEERKALVRVSVFPGGLGVELASLILPAAGGMDALERLVDSALLTLDDREEGVRFKMMGPVREYLRRGLSPEEEESLRMEAWGAVRELVARTGVSPERPLTPRVLAALDAEYENIVHLWQRAAERQPAEAVELIKQLWAYQVSRGRQAACLALAADLEPFWRELPPDDRAALELAMAGLHMAGNKEALAHEYLVRAEGLAQATANPEFQARVAIRRAAWAFRKDFWNAHVSASRALELSLSAGNKYLEARARQVAGSIAQYKQEWTEAADQLDRAFVLFREMEEFSYAGLAGLYLASVLRESGRAGEAVRALDRAREVASLSQDPARLALLNETEGRIALAAGRPGDAEEFFRESYRLWKSIGSDFQEADQLLSLTRALIAQGKWEEGRKVLVDSADLWVKDGNEGGLCQSLSAAAAILQHDGSPGEARDLLAFSEAYEAERQLILVASEKAYRESLRVALGAGGTIRRPLTLAGTRELFDLILR
jgi:predicted ATPase/DNA-binding SARP family transcriptional activator